MRNENVERLLKELPSERPPRDFTDRVLARLDASPPRRGGRRALFVAAAGLATVAVLSSGYLAERYERSRAAERVQSLRDEYREMREELEKLRALADELEPVLRLGGTDDVEFVFDLRGLPAERDLREKEDNEAARTEPASHRSNPRR